MDDLLTGESTVYQYNTSGALTEIIQVNVGKRVTSFFEYTYNEDNALSTAEYNYEYAVGDATDTGLLDYAYGYDESDRLVRYNIHGSGAEANGYIDYVYDGLGRTTHRTTNFPGFKSQAVYTFADKNNQYTTTHVNSYTSTVNDVVTNAYTYKYDVNGNIYLITDSAGEKIKYTYDDQNQLTREDNQPQKKTFVYTYDYAGNRTSKKTYTYTTGSVTGLDYTEIKYEYTNDWGDQLTKVGSTAITYDALGNPTTYNGYALTWEGRQLMEMESSSRVVSFAYNADGLRTSKTVNDVEHIYTLEGSRIVSEAWGNNLLVYLYDENGAPIGMQYRQAGFSEGDFFTFFYEKNIFGDIVAVYNDSGTKVLSYAYDAWGNHTTTWHYSIGTNLYATYNPFRFRGYYYDTDIGLYYLQSRYYNPQWGRFLNADGYISTGTGLLGYNMYAYCNNNPVMYVDHAGHKAQDIMDTIFRRFDGKSSNKLTNENDDCIPRQNHFINHLSIVVAAYSKELGQGWRYRIEIHPGKANKRHIHIYNKQLGREYSQNDDGSPHDGSTGSPPPWIRDELKSRGKWDWDSNKSNYNMSALEQQRSVIIAYYKYCNPFQFILPYGTIPALPQTNPYYYYVDDVVPVM